MGEPARLMPSCRLGFCAAMAFLRKYVAPLDRSI
jgi:hypothetical protein